MTTIAMPSRSTLFQTTKSRTLAALGAILAAVALPQVFHTLGAVSGMGAALGQSLLPMHLPVLLVGLLAGPVTGLIAGALSPLISFALSGMPAMALLPFMVVELAGYGFAAGLLATTNLPALGKVALAQIVGRLARVAAVLAAIYLFDNQAVTAASVWGAAVTGLPGLVLQWSILPLLLFWIENRERHHE